MPYGMSKHNHGFPCNICNCIATCNKQIANDIGWCCHCPCTWLDICVCKPCIAKINFSSPSSRALSTCSTAPLTLALPLALYIHAFIQRILKVNGANYDHWTTIAHLLQELSPLVPQPLSPWHCHWHCTARASSPLLGFSSRPGSGLGCAVWQPSQP